METLCFTGNYTRRFARVKEFSNETAEVVIDEFLKQFCNTWLEEEFTIQSGAEWYQRTEARLDRRGGHYTRTIITGRGMTFTSFYKVGFCNLLKVNLLGR